MHAEFLAWSGLPAELLPDFERDWTLQVLVNDDKVVALGAIKGTELHFAVAPEARGRVVSRSNVKLFLAPLFDRHGFLSTRVWGDASADFVERMGFVLTREDHETRYYMLTALPFARKTLEN